MPDILDYMPRFVASDGTVILPEDIREIDFEIGVVISRNGLITKISGCRIDAQAPFRDKNRKRVFERDLLEVDMAVYTAYAPLFRDNDGKFYFGYPKEYLGATSVFEVTGMVPFEEEKR